jgi:hypothetical protein
MFVFVRTDLVGAVSPPTLLASSTLCHMVITLTLETQRAHLLILEDDPSSWWYPLSFELGFITVLVLFQGQACSMAHLDSANYWFLSMSNLLKWAEESKHSSTVAAHGSGIGWDKFIHLVDTVDGCLVIACVSTLQNTEIIFATTSLTNIFVFMSANFILSQVP